VQDLGAIGASYGSQATCVNADGSVVAGITESPVGARAFRWTGATGMVSLGTLPGSIDSYATGVSGDGGVVVGYCLASEGVRGFRWTVGQWMQDVGPAEPLGISRNGLRMVGLTGPSGDTRAVLWHEWVGMVDLNSYLPAIGTSLPGWTLMAALAISADGSTIVGYGVHNGVYESWVAVLQGCYANCDGSTGAPALNVLDFTCFLNRFGAGDPYANCDGSTVAPVLNVMDFNCFLNRFTAGCP
jgi:probable HAF family extracellular repeat protein